MDKYEFTPDQIYNLDESSLSTILKPVKVVCEGSASSQAGDSRKRVHHKVCGDYTCCGAVHPSSVYDSQMPMELELP